jgi:hypothetical protein
MVNVELKRDEIVLLSTCIQHFLDTDRIASVRFRANVSNLMTKLYAAGVTLPREYNYQRIIKEWDEIQEKI